MREYTILAAATVMLVIILDLVLGTRLVLNKKFWVFWIVMFVIIFIINGYLTWLPIVTYGESYFLNIRLFTIPIEDFLYGFSLLTGNIIIWEFYSRKKSQTKKN